MSAQHTPGRLAVRNNGGDWSASNKGNGNTCWQALTDDAGTVVALAVAHDPEPFSEPDCRANAARLALCWNTHDELVAALQLCADSILLISNSCNDHPRLSDKVREAALDAHIACMKAARAAIAKATGEAA